MYDETKAQACVILVVLGKDASARTQATKKQDSLCTATAAAFYSNC